MALGDQLWNCTRSERRRQFGYTRPRPRKSSCWFKTYQFQVQKLDCLLEQAPASWYKIVKSCQDQRTFLATSMTLTANHCQLTTITNSRLCAQCNNLSFVFLVIAKVLLGCLSQRCFKSKPESAILKSRVLFLIILILVLLFSLKCSWGSHSISLAKLSAGARQAHLPHFSPPN